MNTKYKFGEGSVDQADRQYIEERLGKFERLLNGYTAPDEIFCELEIFKDKKDFWNIEIILQTPHNLYKAGQNSRVLTEAFDRLEEMMKKQILKDKKRVKDLRERGARSFKKKLAIDLKARF